ncbi:MAG TPA: hypothetical protein VN969_05020, partial [Streptosporangiaceae bacterium]|nr:hypothetical protein [Streptosporangiaceae bacterium]
IVLIIVGYALYSNILPPFAIAHTRVGPAGIGIIKLANTLFIVIAQIPATRVVKRMRRARAALRRRIVCGWITHGVGARCRDR